MQRKPSSYRDNYDKIDEIDDQTVLTGNTKSTNWSRSDDDDDANYISDTDNEYNHRTYFRNDTDEELTLATARSRKLERVYLIDEFWQNARNDFKDNYNLTLSDVKGFFEKDGFLHATAAFIISASVIDVLR